MSCSPGGSEQNVARSSRSTEDSSAAGHPSRTIRRPRAHREHPLVHVVAGGWSSEIELLVRCESSCSLIDVRMSCAGVGTCERAGLGCWVSLLRCVTFARLIGSTAPRRAAESWPRERVDRQADKFVCWNTALRTPPPLTSLAHRTTGTAGALRHPIRSIRWPLPQPWSPMRGCRCRRQPRTFRFYHHSNTMRIKKQSLHSMTTPRSDQRHRNRHSYPLLLGRWRHPRRFTMRWQTSLASLPSC